MILNEHYDGHRFDDFWSFPDDVIGMAMSKLIKSESRFDDPSYYLISEEKAQSNLEYVKSTLNSSGLMNGSDISKLQWLAYVDIERIYREALEEKSELDSKRTLMSSKSHDRNNRYFAFGSHIAPAYHRVLAFIRKTHMTAI